MIIRNSPTWLIFHSQIERYRRKDKNVHYEIISKVGSMLIGPNPDDWNWPEANTVVWIIQHFSRFPGVTTLSISHRHVSIISTSKLICSMTFSNQFRAPTMFDSSRNVIRRNAVDIYLSFGVWLRELMCIVSHHPDSQPLPSASHIRIARTIDNSWNGN